ncbi:MAG: BamA/TamA family outer membrane protein [Proteobacteria bacterium]|nr:BamA/TamA family outer membrane protein [Pseudomonadota bacterium]
MQDVIYDGAKRLVIVWLLLIVAGELFAIVPDRRRSFEDRRENVYMVIPAIASMPGAGVFAGVLGSFSNIAGTGIDAAVTQAETIGAESDIHMRAFAFREVPLLLPGLTIEFWFGDIKLNDYHSYLPGRNSPNFTVPYTGEFEYYFLRPVWRFWERRFSFHYSLVFFKGYTINDEGNDVESASHSARGTVIVDLTDDETDPRKGIRLRHTTTLKAPSRSVLGKDSESDSSEEEEDELIRKEYELSVYVPITDRFTLVLYNQRFFAEGREDSDDIVSGGSLNLRGYPGGRWSDRYGETNIVEGRYTIPTDLDMDVYLVHGVLEGIQLATFYEVGQVNPEQNGDLYKELHQSYGFGVRALLEAIVLRLDLAYSDEGNEVHLTIDQPF